MERRNQLRIYRSCKPVVDAWYNPESGRTLMGVLVDALAEAKGTIATEIPPLYGLIDTEALAGLFEGSDRTEGTERVLGFTVENWNVFVRADGRIRVCDATQETEPEPVFETPAI